MTSSSTGTKVSLNGKLDFLPVQDNGNSIWRCEGEGCQGEKKGCRVVVNEKEGLVLVNRAPVHLCVQAPTTSTPLDVEGQDEEDDNVGFGMFD